MSVIGAEALPKVSRFIQVDEEGYFKMEDLRVADAEAGREWLARLTMDTRGRALTTINGETILVEAFDEPYVALGLTRLPGHVWRLTLPYGHEENFPLQSLTLDEWDRFHGRTERGIPFVFSRSAQSHFFNLVDEFEDDAITVEGLRIETKPWLQKNPAVSDSNFWSEIYRTEEPRWDLHAPSPALIQLVPKLKLPKMRVIVPGAGTGNDAAWFAQQGHLVTAVDFSDEAVAKAKERYGHLPNLKFMKADVFNLPSSMNSSFDLVFEHTCYCAIDPDRRNELVRLWRRLLIDHGHLMGVFFAIDKPMGPPYGGSEWEIRSRLQKSFRPLYWTRLRDSHENRFGQELFVYAEKLPSL